MSKDPPAPLDTAGLQRLPEPMRAVFDDLSPEELRVANTIQERLNALVPDVEGQISDPGSGGGGGNTNNTLC
ncbi:aroma-sacti cluster domain-containing protein [Actinoallomurus rhizosphaericola]|uniref:aroma-sacti cluster domain-containing protein n=1 Tax=Actinoallomurus rhizosphaericola TaxID=2952536 RepID=UPI0020911A0D|nr:aroma-sacti cluster domain-containing protein [Actinoallomurus rhizosphaericola]MCO5991780.1 hypothetical protein [Actinoallomurus rhizosphaericola]